MNFSCQHIWDGTHRHYQRFYDHENLETTFHALQQGLSLLNPRTCAIPFLGLIAPKAGLAHHPAKGRYGAEISGLNSSGF
jgi:hypothetical protein